VLPTHPHRGSVGDVKTSENVLDAIADACEKNPAKASKVFDVWKDYELYFPSDKTSLIFIDVNRDIELYDASDASSELLRDAHKATQKQGKRAAICISFRGEGLVVSCDSNEVEAYAGMARQAIADAAQAGGVGRFLWKLNRRVRSRLR
jgi:hypothetical protein